MRKRLATFLAAVAATAALAAIPTTAAAKSCSSAYVHAVIGGSEKCLHAGEYCARSEARQYVRYGFSCVRYAGGTFRLRSRD